jgi:hypothetical protein
MLVKDLFEQDPTTWRLVNEGVSNNNAADLDTLRYELRTFVCDGEYHSGLKRILEGYLDSLGKVQKAAWVSGFYGSGKSHLVKVLRYLWTDLDIGEGHSARTIATLPDDVQDLLKELTTKGKQHGGLHSAGGTLKSGIGNVRLRILGIVFQSAGLPEKLSIARLKLDLRDEGTLEAIEEGIRTRGKDPATEILKPYTSKAFKASYLESYPDYNSLEQVSDVLMAEYPAKPSDLSIDDTMTLMRRALLRRKVLPCTVVVLDEVQQFINGDSAVALEVQEVVEACTNGLDGKVMFVGTGQSALTDTPALQRLMGRFTVKVHLRDNDVDKVIRTIVLRKKETRKKDIEDLVSKNAGEISRQLKNTKLATRSDDDRIYVADYPLLPVRRRFWEQVLHACDPSGTAAQMRTQLRVTHEACRSVAKERIGAVIPGDFLYTQLANDLVMSGEMQKRFQEIIDEQKGKKNGELRSRVCGLIFLINKLPRDNGDNGVRASAEHLADLLTTDLSGSASEVRQAVPKVLGQLRDEGILMQVDDEYRLQTTEGATWEAEYRSRRASWLNNEPGIAAARGQELSKALQTSLSGSVYVHGAAKVARKAIVHHGSEAPANTDALTIWVRDGFQESETVIRGDIQKRSMDDPTIHVVIPREKKDELKQALANSKAAEETVNSLGTPNGREGEEARSSMLSRQNAEGQRVSLLVREVVADSRVFLSGGQEIAAENLRSAVQAAQGQVLQRLYPKFDVADSPNWGTVWKKAKEGNASALSQIGYVGDPDKHSVTAEVLKFIGAGKKGSEIVAKYASAPFGWPKDSIDAALAVLMTSGHLAARLQGNAVGIGSLDQKKVSQADYRQQHPVLTAGEKLKIRKLFADAGHRFTAGEEAVAATAFVALLRGLAERAGGIPPAPQVPSTPELIELGNLQGNDLLYALFEKENVLREKMDKWREVGKVIAGREPAFRLAERLVSHGGMLPGFDAHASVLEAIRTNRSLLDEPDPVTPLLNTVSESLRIALRAAHNAFEDLLSREKELLETAPAWVALSEAKRDTMLVAAEIASRPVPLMDSHAELAHSLDATPLSAWRTQTDALPARFNQVLHAAIQESIPKAKHIRLPAATIENPQQLDGWIAKAKQIVTAALEDGPVIL